MEAKKSLLLPLTILLSMMLSVVVTLTVVDFVYDFDLRNDEIVSEVKIEEMESLSPSVNEVYDAVFLLESYNGNRFSGTGTGFVYKQTEDRSYIMTNHHVITNGNRFVAISSEGQEIEVELLGSDEFSDIAVLAIDNDAVSSVAKIGSSIDLNVGDTLFTVGSPLGRRYINTVTRGILSGKNRQVTVTVNRAEFIMEVLQTDAAINPGNSGGPLLNYRGEVIGVNTLKLVQDTIEGMGFAIPIEMAMAAAERLEKGEDIQRPILGIEMIDVSNTYTLFLNRIYLSEDVEYGVVIIRLDEEMPAYKAGLQAEDVIVAINGEKVENSAQLRFNLYKYNVGETIEIEIFRGDEKQVIDVLLEHGID